jgi:uncharacterized repeat protein (TIGR03803 family)
MLDLGNCQKMILAAILLIYTHLSSFGDNGVIFSNLYSFGYASGPAVPREPLTQYPDNSFYGVTTTGDGSVFRVTPNGGFTSLFSFAPSDGSLPQCKLLLATDGNFYGTAARGGMYNLGTLFRISPSGLFTNVLSFTGTNGSEPVGGLMQASDGWLYGTTGRGGSAYDKGTIFKISTNGIFETLVIMNGTNGGYPTGPLLEASPGMLYGTSASGGSFDKGTVFQMCTNSNFNTLVSFNETNGSWPKEGLVQGKDGYIYGTTSNGGGFTNENGARPFGTVFRIRTDGALWTLYSFSGVGVDGSNPVGGLLQGSDGGLYGTTWGGGQYGMGTVFRVTTNGVLDVSYSFHAFFAIPRDGAQPYAGLVQGTDGYFYGTTSGAGDYGGGTFFRFAVAPKLHAAANPNQTIQFFWDALVGAKYVLQYSSDLSSGNWNNLGSPITATSTSAATSDLSPTDQRRFYRLQVFP